MTRMVGDSETRHQVAQAQRAHVRERLLYIGQLRELWQAVSDQDFERNYRTKYFGDYHLTRREALRLLERWEEELIEHREAGERIELRILWEIPSIQRLMWAHLKEFFVRPAPTTVPRPITAKPASAENLIVREHFPGPALLIALAVQISILFISFNPITQRAYQKLNQLNQEQTITYYKLSEYLPEVFSTNHSKELPKTARIIPKKTQTIISDPAHPDNDLQTIIQPKAPKATDLAEIKIPNIISVKPQVIRPAEPPLPTLAPSKSMDLPKDLLIPIPPAIPPKADVGRRALSDIKVDESEIVNMEPRLLLKPNPQLPEVKSLPNATFGNTFSNVPVPKGPTSVPTVTPEIGRFAKVDMPDLVALSVHPAPPEKTVKAPNVSKAASFSTEPGNGNGGAPPKSGALKVPGITVQGGGLTNPGAAVVQTEKLPAQMASNIPPSDRTPRITRNGKSPGKAAELNLPRPPLLSLERSRTSPSAAGASETKSPLTGENEKHKKVYTAYLNLANLSSSTGSWVMRFSEYDDPTLTASKSPSLGGEPDGELSSPRLLKSEHPRYPPSAMYDRVQGNVVLTAIIRKNGTVDTIKVERSVDKRLDEAAMEALKHWLFSPSERDGKPVDVFAEITIPFHLKVKPY